jgi:hypothetical protein
MSKDHLQFSPSSNIYVQTLIDDVRKISEEIESYQEDDIDNFELFKTLSNNEPDDMFRKNCLSIVLEGKKGVYLALTKGFTSDSFNKEDIALVKKNYQNLENLISSLIIEHNENDEDDDEFDASVLRIAKLNRFKVLMDLSLKMIGRPFIEISTSEMSALESEANRYHSTYPLPGEEALLEELNERNEFQTRMPIKIVCNDGEAVIDLNNIYRIKPDEFLANYIKNLIEYSENTTGLNVTFL